MACGSRTYGCVWIVDTYTFEEWAAKRNRVPPGETFGADDPMQLLICQQNTFFSLAQSLNFSKIPHHEQVSVDPQNPSATKQNPEFVTFVDKQCLCRPGWVHSGSNNDFCIPCKGGAFHNLIDQHACVECPAGKYSSCTDDGSFGGGAADVCQM